MDTLGSLIRKYRRNKNLTLVELGRKVSLTHGYLSNVENNNRKPSPEVLNKLADVLNVPPGEFMNAAGYTNERTRLEELTLKYHELQRALLPNTEYGIYKIENRLREGGLPEAEVNELSTELNILKEKLYVYNKDFDEVQLEMVEIENNIRKQEHDNFYDDMSPEELDKYVEHQLLSHQKFEYEEKEYPELDKLLSRGGYLYFEKYELNQKDKTLVYKILKALFEDKEKSYPTDEQISENYLQYRKVIESAMNFNEDENKE